MGAVDHPRLRGVEKGDLPRIAELEAVAFGVKALPRSTLDILYDSSGGLWLLAEDSDEIWGYSVNLRGEDPRVGWIVGMAVHPDRHRRGWGRILLRETIGRLRAYDMNVIRLLVKPNNRFALDLYTDFGFIETGKRKDHFGSGENRVMMSLLLSDPPRSFDRVLVPQVPCDDADCAGPGFRDGQNRYS